MMYCTLKNKNIIVKMYFKRFTPICSGKPFFLLSATTLITLQVIKLSEMSQAQKHNYCSRKLHPEKQRWEQWWKACGEVERRRQLSKVQSQLLIEHTWEYLINSMGSIRCVIYIYISNFLILCFKYVQSLSG